MRYVLICGLCFALNACVSGGGNNGNGDTASIPGAQTDASMNPGDVVGEDTTSDATAADTAAAANVAATVRVINPATGTGAAGVTVSAGGVETVTDGNGQATVDVPSGPYEIALNQAGARTHTVVGVAGDAAFEQITYMSPENITSMVFGSLGLMDNPERGILVVGLDLPNLAPAVGAGASIDKASDNSFVFAGIQAVFATEIPSNGQGFLTFPNVEPGEVNVTVSYPQGSCRIFPAETEAVPVTVTAGEVTVVAYTCRPE